MSEGHNDRPRVVVTGMGAVSAFGAGYQALWNALVRGQSGIRRISHFDASDVPTQVGGEVPDFDPGQWMDPKDARRNDRFTQFAVAAARLALDDAQLDISKTDPFRVGCIIATGIGGLDTIEKQTFRLWEGGPRKVSPFMVPMLICNMASGVVGIEIGAKGPNYSVVSACASATNAFGDAVRILRAGEADAVVVGGSEASMTRLGYAAFCAMKAMGTHFNDEPERASRPFDAKRDGFIMGEGAGVLVLERLEYALERGANIHAELIGHGHSCDSHHITSPDPEGLGLAKCLQSTLRDARIEPSSVDYINAHGTSTPQNDRIETAAIKSVFGESASDLKISSTKSMTGHLLGAAGGIEAIAAIQSIRERRIPPTINYEYPDPQCDLDYVPNVAVDHSVEIALSCNSGFGGHNAAVLFKRY